MKANKIKNMLPIEWSLNIDAIKNAYLESIDIIEELYDDNDCNLDHHGHCQEHGWRDKSECPHERAKKFLNIRRY